jgi:hypothetical protein
MTAAVSLHLDGGNQDAGRWPVRFEARPPGPPRYEEQDLPLLLQDLRRNST